MGGRELFVLGITGNRLFIVVANSSYKRSAVWSQIKRAARKGELVDPEFNQYPCDQCRWVCLSMAGLVSYCRCHLARAPANYGQFIQLTDFSCAVWQKVCQNWSGLTWHIKAKHQHLKQQQQSTGNNSKTYKQFKRLTLAVSVKSIVSPPLNLKAIAAHITTKRQ